MGELEKSDCRDSVAPRSINKCLLILGLDMDYCTASVHKQQGGIYERHSLEDIAFESKRHYIDSMKRHHPDQGGNVEATKYINSCYDRIKKILRRKGWNRW